MRIAFISGHVDISYDEFLGAYKQDLDDAIIAKDKFVIGNAAGCDLFAFEYLLQAGVKPNEITIYHFRGKYDKEYYLNKGVNVKDGFPSYNKRDEQMTNISDYDIAWVRPVEASKLLYGDKFDPKKKSGTQQNLDRRKKQKRTQNINKQN